MTTPPFYKEIIHNNKRRAPWHDYHSRRIYMVTVTKAPQAPIFGKVININNPSCAKIELTTCGKIILDEITSTPSHNSEIKILNTIIMPDHFHVLLFVTKPMRRHLGEVIQAIKSASTSKIRTKLNNKDLTVFEEGFNDRIITRRGQLDTVYNYINQNPYRLAVRLAFPNFFQRINRLKIGNNYYQAYGNVQLIDNPFKEQVIVHRADNEEQRFRNRIHWLYAAANGSVLVSPFISKDEKTIKSEAEMLKGKFILITPEKFPDRYKPTGHNFQLCEQGRLLIISYPSLDSTTLLSRKHCIDMNHLAERIVMMTQ